MRWKNRNLLNRCENEWVSVWRAKTFQKKKINHISWSQSSALLAGWAQKKYAFGTLVNLNDCTSYQPSVDHQGHSGASSVSRSRMFKWLVSLSGTSTRRMWKNYFDWFFNGYQLHSVATECFHCPSLLWQQQMHAGKKVQVAENRERAHTKH